MNSSHSCCGKGSDQVSHVVACPHCDNCRACDEEAADRYMAAVKAPFTQSQLEAIRKWQESRKKLSNG